MAGYGQHKRKDYTGQTFGYLTAIRDVGSNGKNRLWLLRCAGCKQEIVQSTQDFQRNQSCGCKKNALIGRKRVTHGMSKHPAYWVWRSMIDRCQLPTHQAWKNYGARGIQVCARWQQGFETFWADMGPTYQRGLTLERINNSGNYEPSNCKWGTYQEQARNKRGNRVIDTPWGRITVKEAALRSGLGVTTLLYRINNAWPEVQWFIPPAASNRPMTS